MERRTSKRKLTDGSRLSVRTSLKMTFAVDLGNVTRLYDFTVTVARTTHEGIGLVIDRSRPARSRAVPRRADAHESADVLPLKR